MGGLIANTDLFKTPLNILITYPNNKELSSSLPRKLRPQEPPPKHRPERGPAMLPSVPPGRVGASAAAADAGGLRRHLRQEGHERPAHHALQPLFRHR